MATNLVWSTLHLGNIADMDTNEGTTSIETSSQILKTFGTSGDPLYRHRVDVTTNSSNGDVLNSDNSGSFDTLSYDLGSETVVAQLDSLPLMGGTATFNDGSTQSLTELSVFQDTNGNLFPAIRDDQPALAARGIQNIEFTSVIGSAYVGLLQTVRDDLEFVCYAPGTLVNARDGPRAVETLQVGDEVESLDHGLQVIRWVHRGDHPLEDVDQDAKPVLITAGALGGGRTTQDLVVSPQHRILVGGGGKLRDWFETEAFAPAKSLTSLPGIRHSRANKTSPGFISPATGTRLSLPMAACRNRSCLGRWS